MPSRKGVKDRTGRNKVRSTETKARTHAGGGHEPRVELEKKLDARTRELAEARTLLAEAREQLSEAVDRRRGALRDAARARRLGERARRPVSRLNSREILCGHGHLLLPPPERGSLRR